MEVPSTTFQTTETFQPSESDSDRRVRKRRKTERSKTIVVETTPQFRTEQILTQLFSTLYSPCSDVLCHDNKSSFWMTAKNNILYYNVSDKAGDERICSIDLKTNKMSYLFTFNGSYRPSREPCFGKNSLVLCSDKTIQRAQLQTKKEKDEADEKSMAFETLFSGDKRTDSIEYYAYQDETGMTACVYVSEIVIKHSKGKEISIALKKPLKAFGIGFYGNQLVCALGEEKENKGWVTFYSCDSGEMTKRIALVSCPTMMVYHEDRFAIACREKETRSQRCDVHFVLINAKDRTNMQISYPADTYLQPRDKIIQMIINKVNLVIICGSRFETYNVQTGEFICTNNGKLVPTSSGVSSVLEGDILAMMNKGICFRKEGTIVTPTLFFWNIINGSYLMKQALTSDATSFHFSLGVNPYFAVHFQPTEPEELSGVHVKRIEV